MAIPYTPSPQASSPPPPQAGGAIPYVPGQTPPTPAAPTPTTGGALFDPLRQDINFGKTLVHSEIGLGQDVAASSNQGKQVTKYNQQTNDQTQAFLLHAVTVRNQQKAAGKDVSKIDALIKDLNQGSLPDTASMLPALNKSNGQALGDVVGSAADVLSAGSYGAAKAPVKIAEATVGQTLKTVGKQTLKNAATGAATGYGYDVANNLSEGKTGASALKPGLATLTGAVLPTVAGGYRAGVTISKEQAPRFINSLIKPKLADFAYGKDPGRTVSELGITGNNLHDFSDNITAAKKQVGQSLGNIYSNPANASVRINANPEIAKLDAAMTEAAKGGKNNQSVVNQLQNIKDAILYEHGVDENGVISRVGDTPHDLSNLSPQGAQDLIQHVADQTQFTGRHSDDKLVNSTLKQIYGGIREKINNGVQINNPEVTKLNQQYADLTSAEIATRNRDKIVQRSNMVSLPSGGAAAAGAITTAIVTGGAAIPAVLGGATAYAVEKAFESTAVKTRVAAWLGSQSPSAIQALLTKNPSLRPLLVRAFPALVGKLSGNTNSQPNQ